MKLETIIKKHSQIANDIYDEIPEVIKLFHLYLQEGYYPYFSIFTQEREKYQAVQNTVQKVIYEDIALSHSLKTSSLLTIENLYKFILNSAPGEINAYKLANNLKKDFDSISNYLSYLQQAGLVRFLYSEKSGQAYLRNPVKMYPDNPNLLYAAYLNITDSNLMGKVRETFVLNQLQNADHEVYYTDKGDFNCQDLILEIGGKHKNMKQVKSLENGYVFADGIISGIGKKVPLYLLGLLS